MYKRILPTDTGGFEAAVISAVELAATLDAEVVALNVVPRYPTSYFEGGSPCRPTKWRGWRSSGPTRARRWPTK